MMFECQNCGHKGEAYDEIYPVCESCEFCDICGGLDGEHYDDCEG